MKLQYIIPRVVRHFLPEKFVRFLLLHNWIIQAGLETNDPFAAVQRYAHILTEHGRSLHGKRVMVFGYGGRFDIGFALLKQGAGYVVLCDRYAAPDEEHNRRAFLHEQEFFSMQTDGLRPQSEHMSLLQADIREERVSQALQPFDYVISNSVYEHLEDVEGITRALFRITKPDGLQIHYVDLRDHFFKYPFEMLRFSEKTWRTWLNPSTNHNRYRLWEYRSAFESCFKHVELKILAGEASEFLKVRSQIRPEFVSGNIDEDSATLIRIVAYN